MEISVAVLSSMTATLYVAIVHLKWANSTEEPFTCRGEWLPD